MKLSFVSILLAAGIQTAAAIPLKFVAEDPTSPLGECEADCDTDADCAGDLICYFRHAGFNEGIPAGCDNNAVGDDKDRDFCYDRDAHYNYTAQVHGYADRLGATVNVCEGDCKYDHNCAGNLKCFQRKETTDPLPPGCVGEPFMKRDYCYDPYYGVEVDPSSISLAFIAEDPTSPLGECEADCDTDDDCAGDLVCYFRHASFNEDIPAGCKPSGAEVDKDRDFCYDRDAHYNYTATHYGFAEREGATVNVCEGDCKFDSDCAGRLRCFQRENETDPLPVGCVGEPFEKRDYCYDAGYLEDPSNPPSSAPTYEGYVGRPKKCASYPDPHFVSWGGVRYDFHGGCDVMFLKNPCVEVHLRLQRLVEAQWSAIQSVAVMIGDDTLEAKTNLTGDTVEWRYYINDPSLLSPYISSDPLPQTNVGNWSLTLIIAESNTRLKIISPSGEGYIEIKRIGEGRGVELGFAVSVEGTFDSCFDDSEGMCSKFVEPEPEEVHLYDRNGTIADTEERFKDDFGYEWQIRPNETVISDISLEPLGNESHAVFPERLVIPTLESPESCQDIDAGYPLKPVTEYSDACPHCHLLAVPDLVCNCDTDAKLLSCDAVEDIYNEGNSDFLLPDPNVTLPPTPSPSSSPTFSDYPTSVPSAVPSISLAPSCEKYTICNVHDVCVCSQFPDPHFRTWNGDRYDFHNECDMVHVTNDHLDLHIRTKALWHKGHYWSGVVQVALRFDDDILEINSLEENKVSVNGVPVTSDSFTLDDIYPVTNTFGRLKRSLKSTEKVRVKMSGGQYIDFLVHQDTIVIRMDAHGSDFYESRGMTGYWNKPGLIGRDGVTSFDIPVKREYSHESVLFATEWEVDMNRGDPILFSTPSTAKCADKPKAPPLESEDEARRLVDMEFAKKLCDNVVAEGIEGREECIFDVLRSNFDEDVLDNPEYKDPLTGVERCVAAPKIFETQKAGTNGLSCADLGGECVYRCNTAKYDCRPDAMCIEATDLTVVDAARRRMRKVDFIEGCSCALPKTKASSVTDECIDDAEFKFAVGYGIRGKSMRTCEWLTEMEGRAETYCETKGSDAGVTTMIKSACRGACAEYLSEC